MNIKIEDITAEFVSGKLPTVAQALRDEGAKSVNAEELIANAVKAEREQADVKVASAKVEGANTERKRIAEIQGLAMPGCDALVTKAINDGMTPESFAMAQIAFMKKESPKNEAQSAIVKGEETVAGLGGNSNNNGDTSKLTPRQQAKADMELHKKRGII